MRSFAPVAAVLVIALAANSSGRALAQQRYSMESTKRLIAHANEECYREYPNAIRQAVGRATCENENMRVMREMVAYPDLLDQELSYKLALAERVQSGRMTLAQRDAAVAKYHAEMETEANRRRRQGVPGATQQPPARQAEPPRYVYAPPVGAAEAPEPPRNCRTFSNQIQCDNGLTGFRNGNTITWSNGVVSQRFGNSVLNSDGTSYQQHGNSTYFSDGTTAQTFGNQTFFSDGRMCQRFPDGQSMCN